MPTLLSVNNYHYFRGGAETVFLHHNRMMSDAGWDVVPFAMKHAKNIPTAWDAYFADEIEFGQSYSFSDKLKLASRVVYSFQARRRLSRLLDVSRPDICHAHNIYHHLSPSILGLLRGRDIPVVLTLHDLKVACPAYTMLAHDGICERCRGGHLYNVALHRCIKGSMALSSIVMVESILHRLIRSYTASVRRFVVPSRFYQQKLKDWGFPTTNFRYIPNFVDATQYEPQYQPGDRVLYFGRLSREKGLRNLIRAAAATATPVTIAGVGDQLDELRNLATELSADVSFPGYLSGKQLRQTVSAARAVVLPSEWYENAPMSILEAYACGKPVIVSDSGGLPELVRHGLTGMQFRSGNVEALSHVLEQVSQMEDSILSQMGREGRKLVEMEFSVEAYRARILELYQELGVGMPGTASVRGNQL